MVAHFSIVFSHLLTRLALPAEALCAGMVLMKHSTDGPHTASASNLKILQGRSGIWWFGWA